MKLSTRLACMRTRPQQAEQTGAASQRLQCCQPQRKASISATAQTEPQRKHPRPCMFLYLSPYPSLILLGILPSRTSSFSFPIIHVVTRPFNNSFSSLLCQFRPGQLKIISSLRTDQGNVEVKVSKTANHCKLLPVKSR